MHSTNMSKPVFHNPQLLSLDQKCTKCLLETFVKRSLSLNDGGKKHQLKQCKKVKKQEQGSQARRASSDSSAHRLSVEWLVKTTECTECTTSAPAFQKKSRKTPSRTKSFFRGFLNLFTKKKFDPNLKGKSVLETDSGHSTTEQRPDESVGSSSVHSEMVRKKNSLKRISFSNQNVVSVDSTNAYFERVSEELEWIVKEIQFSPKEDSALLPSAACVGDDSSPAGDDITNRIISLLKQHGDIIDQKIKRNSSVQVFLQRLSYSSFQQLADGYIAQIPSPLPKSTDASLELVRLAFTLDFTAKVAGLCGQTVGRIMGFGNQYLQDSFTQMCAAHTQVCGDLEGQNTSDPD
ncbi:uncharacterized protein LOC127418936 [Myxocyprinus asiaticus]|uniref:uncharacterized protein LOC127418936 n=1 Tax=Myxocyprinus asiaticus TaxID=70543 RepID=UPI002221339B|nr:uncharacterized protein LOC127418936 [Myxocyprinus asiaticus]